MWAVGRVFAKTAAAFVLMLLPIAAVSYWLGESFWINYLRLLLPLGVLFSLIEYTLAAEQILNTRESLLLLPTIWLGLSIVAALPFIVGMPDLAWVDAWFAAVSGVTTTGAEVFADLAVLPLSLLYYRMWLQFLGGLGIVVFAMAWSSLAKEGIVTGVRTDLPGPVNAHSFAPKLAEAAQSLWFMYAALWVACAVICHQLGMSVAEAAFESMGVVSTGGFGLYNDNMAHYDASGIKCMVMIGMLLGSFNYILHYQFVAMGNFSVYKNNKEFKLYLLLLLVAAVLSCLLGYVFQDGISLLDRLFTVCSMFSTSGHQVLPANAVLPALGFMFALISLIGGCAGSTSGGIKVLRLRFFWRDFRNAVAQQVHPQAVFASNIDSSTTSQSDFVLVRGFLVGFWLVLLLFWWFLIITGVDVLQAYSLVVACLSNTGAGLLAFPQSYQQLPELAKYILIVLMLCGRMELMVVFALMGIRKYK